MKLYAVLAAVLVSSAAPAMSEPRKVRHDVEPARFMRVYGTALPPYGFVQFCEAYPRECAQQVVDDQRFPATRERIKELDDLNRLVNRSIKPATDMEMYGVTELWTLPKDQGDCEDYALLKRHLLMKKGWPASSLLLTVVRDEKGEGHAVLTARTAAGDFILDNKTDEMKPWHKTPYELVMRQSYLNPRVWMSLDPRDGASPGALAGLLGRQ